jgi:hypothetical protein
MRVAEHEHVDARFVGHGPVLIISDNHCHITRRSDVLNEQRAFSSDLQLLISKVEVVRALMTDLSPVLRVGGKNEGLLPYFESRARGDSWGKVQQ